MIAVDKSIHESINNRKSKKYFDISMFLISKNANLLIRDNNGATVSHYAMYNKTDGFMMNRINRKVCMENSCILRNSIEKEVNKQSQLQAKVTSIRNGDYEH